MLTLLSPQSPPDSIALESELPGWQESQVTALLRYLSRTAVHTYAFTPRLPRVCSPTVWGTRAA